MTEYIRRDRFVSLKLIAELLPYNWASFILTSSCLEDRILIYPTEVCTASVEYRVRETTRQVYS